MCKLDMKNAYFSVPLHQTSIKYVRFLWSGNLYEFPWLCSGLGLAPWIYKKLLKTTISVLRRINIPVIIYLDSMLLMGQTIKETLMSRDTTIFPLQHLGFIMNMDKSVLQFYCQKKIKRIQRIKPKLKKLIGLLASTIQAVLPEQLNFLYLH